MASHHKPLDFHGHSEGRRRAAIQTRIEELYKVMYGWAIRRIRKAESSSWPDEADVKRITQALRMYSIASTGGRADQGDIGGWDM